MIRQAISCDICGTEKKQTNHWYVASEQGGELRLSGWNSRMRQRAGTKHLCGQTCLHKLLDDFMARTMGVRAVSASAESAEPVSARAGVDASLTSPTAYGEVEAPARAIAAPPAAIPMLPRLVADIPVISDMAPQEGDAPNYSSRRWRAEAWERERNRELRAVERHPELARRHKGG